MAEMSPDSTLVSPHTHHRRLSPPPPLLLFDNHSSGPLVVRQVPPSAFDDRNRTDILSVRGGGAACDGAVGNLLERYSHHGGLLLGRQQRQCGCLLALLIHPRPNSSVIDLHPFAISAACAPQIRMNQKVVRC